MGAVLTGAALGPVFTSCSPLFAYVVVTVLPAEPRRGLALLTAYVVGSSRCCSPIALAGQRLVLRLRWAADPPSRSGAGWGALRRRWRARRDRPCRTSRRGCSRTRRSRRGRSGRTWARAHAAEPADSGVDDVVVERVLRAVEQVPRGRVVSYGDLAALVGIGPRQVGTIMRLYGSNVTWWRVTNASGDLPRPLMDEVRERWAAEGILLKPNGRGCRIADYRADLARLDSDYERATADLAG